jgi:Flp pilus assembly protein TadD
MQAESGARMELQDDGSVFVHQQLPVKKDTYTLVFQPEMKGIRGLRLETFPDSRILNGGSGWGGGDGNFVLNEVTVHVAPAANPDQAKAIALKAAAADFSQSGWDVRGLIDGVDRTGWAVSPETKKEHPAVFELAEEIGDGQALRLTVRLKHLHWDPNYVMGRFRLSVSSSPAAFERDQRRFASTKVTEPWAKLAVAYHLVGDQSALERLLKSHLTAANGPGDLFADLLDWSGAIAEYSKGLTPETKDAELFAKRAEAHEKLKQWELASADWGRVDELVDDKNKRYGGYPSLIRRALAYENLRQFDKASADYRRAVDSSIGGVDPLIWRVNFGAKHGQWREAAADYRQLWKRKEPTWYVGWHYARERALLFLLAGDTDGFRKAAADLLTETEKLVDGDSSLRLLYVHLIAPDMVTDKNRERLTAASDRVDSWANPRMKAALLFRSGKLQEAADLFDKNGGGTMYEFMAAIAQHQLGHADRARQLFEQGSVWMQQQRDSDPGCGTGVPKSVHWHDWSGCVQMQREAVRTLAGNQLADLDTLIRNVKLEIVKAEYGAGTLWRDVTNVLQKLSADGQQITLPSSTYNVAFGGDPAPGKWKELKIQYRINGFDAEVTLAENALVILPIPYDKQKQEPDLADALVKRAGLLAKHGLYADALSDLNRVSSTSPNSSEFLGLRGQIKASLRLDDEALADLNRAIEAQSTDALAYATRGRILQVRGETAQARSDLEKSLGLEPTETAATTLADLLLADSSGWTVLESTEMKSAGGATLSLQPDGSILAGGKTPERETYSLALKSELTRIRAIRLEALPDSSLPSNGPGRHANGNFNLNEFRLSSAAGPATLGGVFVNYEEFGQARLIVDGTIDANCWSIYPNAGRRHTAFFSTDISRSAGDELTVEMYFDRGNYSQTAFGRFRLSVSDDPSILNTERKRIAAIQMPDPWLKLAMAYAMSGHDDLAMQYFNAALQRADGFAARKQIVDSAAQNDQILSVFVKQQPDNPQWQLAWARRLAERGQERLAANLLGEARADLEQSREIFGRLGTRAAQMKWTVLKPSEMSSGRGDHLELQSDGSVFVHAKQPVTNDTYTLAATSRMKDVLGLRLEILADSRLPNGGPGWAGGGNFVLNELTLHASLPSQASPGRAITLQNATADFSQTTSGGFDIRGAVDGNPATAWAIYPQVNKDHTAVFDLSEPLGDGRPSRLTIGLEFKSTYQDHNLGRFRLSLTNDAATLQAARMRMDLRESEIADVSMALAKAHAAQGNVSAASAALSEAVSLTPDRAAKASIIRVAAPLEGVLEHLTEQTASDALFQIELARYYSEQQNVAAANGARAKARARLEQQLEAEPDNAAPATELSNLLLAEIDARISVVSPTAEQSPVNWRSSRTQPPAGWAGLEFDDSAWTEAPAGFGGDLAAAGLFTRTAWTTPDIWLRRKFEWQPQSGLQSLLARVVHDDAFELFINGELALSRQDWIGRYTLYPLDARVLSLLKPGTNLLAVHCHSTIGGQHIDVGILGTSSDLRGTQERLAATKITDPWSRLAAVWYLLGDQRALARLLERHPAAAAGLGDIYGAAQDWKRAIAEYNQAITPETTDAAIFAARAEFHEKLEDWELAIADWNSADRHAIDKKTRYGNPSFPALEHRAQLHSRLQQWSQQVEAYTELLKPERFGDLTWFYSGRGEAYRRLRQFDKARADFDQAVKISSGSERAIFLNVRALFFAAQGDWNQAAENMRQLYQNSPDQNREWSLTRDAALIFAMAGDEANARQAAQECLRKSLTANLSESDNRWSIIPMLQLPGLITAENRSQLGELAEKSDAFWRPRLQAAIHFHSGEYQQAAKIFEVDPPGEYFAFLAAIVQQKLGNLDRSRQMLEEGCTWVRERRASDSGSLIPNPYGWQDWATIVGLQAEAVDLILGKVAAEPRKLALRGQLVEAAQLYAKALATSPDEASRLRILDEMALFGGMETAVFVINNDWKSAAASYSLQVEASTDSIAWMVAASLWAYAGDAERHRRICQKMSERCRLEEDRERILKVMLLIDKGPRLSSDEITAFYASCDSIAAPIRPWYLSSRAFYESRRGKYVAAHQSVEESLAREKDFPYSPIKAVALAVKALTYARQKDVANARQSLEQLNHVMTQEMNMTRRADGTLEGSTVLGGLIPDSNKLIPEILRREAENLIGAPSR